MKRIWFVVTWMVIFTLALSACGTPAPAMTSTAAGPEELTVMVHDSFSVTEQLVKDFEAQNNVKVTFLKAGDAGSMINRAVLSKNAPLADVLYGVDNTFLSRALNEDIFESYDAPALAQIPASFKVDSQNRVLPVDYGDVCLNYDKAYFSEKGLVLPESLEELTKPEYKGLLVMENPATSSPGLAFLLATIAHFGPDEVWNYWAALRDNDLVVVNDWSTAYSVNFSGSSGKGQQPLVVSYGSSPAVEVVYATSPVADAPTAPIVAADMCFRQIEFVGILKGTSHRALAEKFVDFMLSTSFQEDMPLQMYVYPVDPAAKLPEVFTKYSEIPVQPVLMPPDIINANRDSWIQKWTETVLR